MTEELIMLSGNMFAPAYFNALGNISSVNPFSQSAFMSNPFALKPINLTLPQLPKLTFNPQLQTSGSKQQSVFNSTSGSFADRIRANAKSYIGFSESDNSYLKFTQGREEAWCADFVSYCARQSGLSNFNFSSVEGIRQWGIENKKYKSTPKEGDAIILKNGASHTGIVDNVDLANNTVTVTEGNSSDQVQQVTYSLNDSRISGYVTLA